MDPNKIKRIHTIAVIIMVALVALSSFSTEGFFAQHGMTITLLVCVVWVFGGLIRFSEFKIGFTSIMFALLIAFLSIGTKLYNYNRAIRSVDDLLELASYVIMVAVTLAYLLRDMKKDE